MKIYSAFCFQGGMAEVNEKMIGNNHEMIGTEIKMDVIYTPPTTDSPFYEADVKPLDSNSVAISLGNVHIIF